MQRTGLNIMVELANSTDDKVVRMVSLGDTIPLAAKQLSCCTSDPVLLQAWICLLGGLASSSCVEIVPKILMEDIYSRLSDSPCLTPTSPASNSAMWLLSNITSDSHQAAESFASHALFPMVVDLIDQPCSPNV